MAGVQELKNGSVDFRLLDGYEFLSFAVNLYFAAVGSLSPVLLQLLNSCQVEISRAFSFARFPGLILNTAHRDAFDHQFLRKEEDQDYRQHGHAHGGHDH